MSTTTLNKAEKLLQTYRNLARIPAIAGGNIAKNGAIINSVWSQRNIEKGKMSKFIKSHVIVDNGDTRKSFVELIPIDISTESLSTFSQSENFRAVIRDVENKEGSKQFLEVWQKSNLMRAIDLTSLDLHGNVYTDGEFASFEFSPNEKQVLYVAELKVPKKDPINKRPAQKTDAAIGDKDKNINNKKVEEYMQDWGEQLVDKKTSICVIYDLELDEFKILTPTLQNVCLAQPTWAPDGSYIVGIAYRTVPRKLGLIYCTNRVSTIFKLDLDGLNYGEIALVDQSVKCPRFTPDGKNLIWLQRPAGGPHYACMSLVRTPLPITKKVDFVTIIDFVKTQIQIIDNKAFYGLYNVSFPRRCFASNDRLILSTNQRNTINTYIINLANSEISELEYGDGSQIVLDVIDDNLLVARRNFLRQDVLAMGKLGQNNNVVFLDVTESKIVEGLENCMFQYLDLQNTDNQTVTDFSAIYVGPKTGSEKEVPLIIWPHGGPHSAFANNLSLEASFFTTLGYGVLMVNYRGSIGAGQASVEYLLGKCGDADVSDCILATKQALAQFPWLDEGRIGLVGGSHGGFLVTHLAGQQPDMYRAVVARNPVIDIASMSMVSDIPDWCYVECGAEYSQVGPIDNEMLLTMRKASPIQFAHLVKAPTLLQVGTNDLRVPPSQSIDYYHRLKANNIVVGMNIYNDNHPLGQVPNEMDNIISTAHWLDEHLVKQ